MIPLKDDNPTIHPPVITMILIVLNVGVYFLWQTRGGELETAVRTFRYAAVPFNITRGPEKGEKAVMVVRARRSPFAPTQLDVQYAALPAGQVIPPRSDPAIYDQAIPPWTTLIMSMFMHGSIMHLLGNMLFLWIFGNNIEDATGAFRFLAFYLITGLAASAGHILSDPDSLIPSLGASGAISGIMGGYLVLYPGARILALIPLPGFLTTMYLPAFVFLVIWLAMQFSGVLGSGGGVAWWAHIGGFVAGLLLIKVLESGEHRQRRMRPAVPPPFRNDWR